MGSGAPEAVTNVCPCGLPLHYSDGYARSMVNLLIEKFGEYMTVRTPHGAWLVSRHYAALHGIDPLTLPADAARFGFQPVEVVEIP